MPGAGRVPKFHIWKVRSTQARPRAEFPFNLWHATWHVAGMVGLGAVLGCGIMLLANEVAGTCPGCRLAWPVLPPMRAARPGAIARGRPPWALGFRLCADRGTSQVLHRMKYGGLAALPSGLALDGRDLATPTPDTVLVPVPSHWRRRLRRGFNPRNRWRVACPTLGVFGGAFLVGQGRPQAFVDGVVAGGAHARVEGLLRCPAHRDARNVVLVDDVLTTGRLSEPAPRLGGGRPHVSAACGWPWLDRGRTFEAWRKTSPLTLPCPVQPGCISCCLPWRGC